MIRISYRTQRRRVSFDGQTDRRTYSAMTATLVVDEQQSYVTDSAHLVPGEDNVSYCREFVAKWEAHAAALGLDFEIDGDARHLLGDPVLMGGAPTTLVLLED